MREALNEADSSTSTMGEVITNVAASVSEWIGGSRISASRSDEDGVFGFWQRNGGKGMKTWQWELC